MAKCDFTNKRYLYNHNLYYKLRRKYARNFEAEVAHVKIVSTSNSIANVSPGYLLKRTARNVNYSINCTARLRNVCMEQSIL